MGYAILNSNSVGESMRNNILAFLIVVVWVHPVLALDEEILSDPNADLVSFYLNNNDEIERIRATIKEGNPAKNQVESFSMLSFRFPFAAQITARGLVSNQNTDLALMAIHILKLNRVMSEDKISGGIEQPSPRVSRDMKQYIASRNALRDGVLDSRPEIRAETGKYLASLSDEVALDAIAYATGELYSDLDAVNIFTLASGDVGASYVSKYLGTGSSAAQMIAIGYLGTIPSYHEEIRSTYFLNLDALGELRVSSAQVLSIYDRNFTEYALAAIAGEAVNPIVVVATIQGYITATNSQGTLIQPDLARTLLSKLLTNVAMIDPAQLKGVLYNKLDMLQKQLNSIIGSER